MRGAESASAAPPAMRQATIQPGFGA